MSNYPADYFARGITRPECLFKDKIRSCVFDFDKNVRPDGNREMSIIWLVDKESISYAKGQINKKGESQFKLGFAIVNKNDLDCLIKDNNGKICHEIDHLPHGLIISSLEKVELKRISQHLAECSRYYSYSDNIPLGVS